jgi:hypothetical protein
VDTLAVPRASDIAARVPPTARRYTSVSKLIVASAPATSPNSIFCVSFFFFALFGVPFCFCFCFFIFIFFLWSPSVSVWSLFVFDLRFPRKKENQKRKQKKETEAKKKRKKSKSQKKKEARRQEKKMELSSRFESGNGSLYDKCARALDTVRVENKAAYDATFGDAGARAAAVELHALRYASPEDEMWAARYGADPVVSVVACLFDTSSLTAGLVRPRLIDRAVIETVTALAPIVTGRQDAPRRCPLIIILILNFMLPKRRIPGGLKRGSSEPNGPGPRCSLGFVTRFV